MIGRGGVDEPLERTKMKIIDKLQRMNKHMSEYTEDVEDKLEKAYGALGAHGAKKYGFNKASTKHNSYEDGPKDNWELNKLKK